MISDAPEPSMASLVGGIVNDAQALIKQELALAKREVTDELNKAKEAAHRPGYRHRHCRRRRSAPGLHAGLPVCTGRHRNACPCGVATASWALPW